MRRFLIAGGWIRKGSEMQVNQIDVQIIAAGHSALGPSRIDECTVVIKVHKCNGVWLV